LKKYIQTAYKAAFGTENCYTFLMKEYLLEEDRGHIVYFAEYGNPKGLPVLGFHGGPGSKSRPAHADPYDLKKYRVILFDQRGCGKSTPLGEIENNTTEDLLQDAERIREKC
jgi:proline iminopeptidase